MSEFMRSIAVFGKDDVRMVDDVIKPEIKPYECLVKTRACGFCNGTDFHIIRGQMAIDVDAFPILLGHEGVGEIVEVGSKVKNYRVGQRFINPPFVRTTEKYGATWGQMSDYGVIQDSEVMDELGIPESERNGAQNIMRQIPDDFDCIDAGVMLSLNECFSAAKNFTVEGKDVLVYGAGPMGLGTMKYMRILGAKSITCIDSVDERLELAKTLSGVDRTINFAKEDKDEILGDELFDRVIDIVGLTSILMEGSQRLRPYGIVGSMGVLKNTDAVVDVTKLKNNTLLQMLNFPYGQYDITSENVELMRKGVINPKDFYTHVRKPEQIDEVLQLVTTKEALKVVIDFD